VLLLGDMQGGESLDGVPQAARKALNDTKDFLPYRNYRLLDSQWTLCCGGTASAITRLRGVDEQEYELELRSSAVLDASRPPAIDPNALSVRFVLRELTDGPAPSKTEPYPEKTELHPDRVREPQKKGGSGSADARVAQISQELFSLERERVDLDTQVTTMRSQVEVGTRDPVDWRRASNQLNLVTSRIQALKAELGAVSQSKAISGGKSVIDTSFRIELGETVVVGTSGLKGGKRALIALLTAVGKRPTPR
jgi:hypothetical protein